MAEPDSTPVYQSFDSLAEYRQAIGVVIASARLTLDIFDHDLSAAGFDSPQRIDALRAFLARSRAARLRMVLRDANHVMRDCARLHGLLRKMGHAMEIRQVCDEDGHDDVFMYSDAGVCLYRPHYALPRSVLTTQDQQRCRLFRGRFSALVEASTPVVMSTTLGL